MFYDAVRANDNHYTKIWSFPFRISSVNVTKSAIPCGFGHIYWKKSLMENFIFCAVNEKICFSFNQV